MGKIDVSATEFYDQINQVIKRLLDTVRVRDGKKSPHRCDVYVIAVFSLDQCPLEVDGCTSILDTISPLESFEMSINKITFLMKGSDLSIVDNLINSYQIFEDR